MQPENQCKVSQPTYAYKIYHLHGRRAIYPRDSQPTYAYKIYLRRCQSGCNFPSLTTYICIQDISAFVANFKWCFELTTYICIQDISIPFSHNCNGMYHSQPTYAYKIYLTRWHTPHLHFISQPTYAYKIYRGRHERRRDDSTAHNLHMHTRYILFLVSSIPDAELTTYICIQDISSNKYKYKLPTRIKFVGFIPCREYLLFYIRNLCILSRLKDAEPPLISVRISYVFFVCFSFALLIFKVFSIMSSIFFIPIF